MQPLQSLLANAAVAQTEAISTPPMEGEGHLLADYGLPGGVVLVVSLLLFLSMRRRKPAEVAEAEAPAPTPQPIEVEPDLEAQAQAVFKVPKVLRSTDETQAHIKLTTPGASTAPDPAGDAELARRVAAETARLAKKRAQIEAQKASSATRKATNRARRADQDGARGEARRQRQAAATTRKAEAEAKAEARRAEAAEVAAREAADKAAAEVEAERLEGLVEETGRTLREGLARTHDGFAKRLGGLFGSAKVIDDDLLGDLEEALFTADIGVRTSQRLMDMVMDGMKSKALRDPKKVWAQLKDEIARVLTVESPPLDFDRGSPFVVMVVGVNGAGKTTSIGKLAARYKAEGHSVMLAAGDTFRAAAVEQLEVWGERANVPVVKGASGSDPSSVIFDACKRAQAEGIDVVFADTAGRLQARKELMDELAKVHRAIGKAVPGAPHEVWLVLDSTNGQNAISQAKEFTKVVDVTGIVLTKLDGTAKGGVVIGISDEMKLPVRYIGIGEQVEDLRPFVPAEFIDALFSDTASDA